MLLPELETARLSVRLARPGMERAMAAFFVANFPGHLERWSPPVTRAFFTEAFWGERLALAVQEFEADRAVRFVMQPRGPADGPIIGTANYTNIARGAFQACHLGYQVAADHEGRGFMAVLRAVGEGPGFAQCRDVGRVDLVQRAEAGVGVVARLAAPLARAEGFELHARSMEARIRDNDGA